MENKSISNGYISYPATLMVMYSPLTRSMKSFNSSAEIKLNLGTCLCGAASVG